MQVTLCRSGNIKRFKLNCCYTCYIFHVFDAVLMLLLLLLLSLLSFCQTLLDETLYPVRLYSAGRKMKVCIHRTLVVLVMHRQSSCTAPTSQT